MIPQPARERLRPSEVREVAQSLFGAVGSGKQMAQAMGVHYGTYKAAMARPTGVPYHWADRVRAVQKAHRGYIPGPVRLALQGAYAGSQVALDRLAPSIHAFADKAEAEGLSPRDVSAALLSVGALRLVRSP